MNFDILNKYNIIMKIFIIDIFDNFNKRFDFIFLMRVIFFIIIFYSFIVFLYLYYIFSRNTSWKYGKFRFYRVYIL